MKKKKSKIIFDIETFTGRDYNSENRQITIDNILNDTDNPLIEPPKLRFLPTYTGGFGKTGYLMGEIHHPSKFMFDMESSPDSVQKLFDAYTKLKDEKNKDDIQD